MGSWGGNRREERERTDEREKRENLQKILFSRTESSRFKFQKNFDLLAGVVVVHAFNPNTGEAEADGSL